MATPKQKPIKYYVNGEAETTEQKELSVREILESAGFEPATDYKLKSENPKREYDDYDEKIKLHPNERFDSVFKGPTPTS